MPTNVYDQHKASFPHVSAYVVMAGADRIGSIAFKFPRDGAGRLYCYLHVIGVPMVRGFANGYGYDKKSAAMESAAERMKPTNNADFAEYDRHINAIKAALAKDEGYDWDRRLRTAGYQVLQAV